MHAQRMMKPGGEGGLLILVRKSAGLDVERRAASILARREHDHFGTLGHPVGSPGPSGERQSQLLIRGAARGDAEGAIAAGAPSHAIAELLDSALGRGIDVYGCIYPH